jgi:hypothetical protein
VLLVGAGGVGVAHHDGLEIQHHGVARGGFAAHIGDGAGDQDRVVALRAQSLRQIGGALHESAETILQHHLVLRQHFQIWM